MWGNIFFNSITLLSLFVTGILILFFIITKRGNRIENLMLSAILFLFFLQIVYSFAVSNYAFRYFLTWHKEVFILKQTSFLLGPLIYLYLVSFLQRVNIFNKKSLFHFIPFFITMIALPFYYYKLNNFIIWRSGIDIYDTILILIQNLIYIVLSVKTIKSLHGTFSTFFKHIRTSSYITWLQVLFMGFIMAWVMKLNTFAVYMILQNPDWCAYTGSIFVLVIFLFMSSLMFLLLLKPDIFYILEKYRYSCLDEKNKKEYLQKLADYFEKEKPYLNPGISLELLAQKISLSPKTLSQVINESYNCNFKGYINEFRIKESMRLLSDNKNNKKTILEILYEVGFNSKSVFNHQFKKYTGLTPLEYRAKQTYKTTGEILTDYSLTRL